MRPAPCTQSTLFFLNRNSMPLVSGPTDSAFCFIIWGRLSFGVDLDARVANSLPAALEQLRGVQQRLGRHAADVQAGAAQRGAPLCSYDAATFRPSWPARIAAL
jgi:hypothetical protein